MNFEIFKKDKNVKEKVNHLDKVDYSFTILMLLILVLSFIDLRV
jgi:hypothetical protein